MVAILALVLAASWLDVDPQLRRDVSAEVEPAPLPTRLPLVRVPGLDAFGGPRSWVDPRGFRTLLDAGRFQDLSRYFEELQAEFERDPRSERWLDDAITSLEATDPATSRQLDAWVDATPNAFAPYLVRASHRLGVAFQRRGGRWASETKAEEFAAFGAALARALEDVDRALSLRPRLVAALTLRLKVMAAGGDDAGRDDALRRALRACQTCYLPRQAYIWTLAPRWGGSYEAMAALAAAAPVARNPRLRLLRAAAHLDRASLLHLENRGKEALEACERAVAVGPNASALMMRSDLRAARHDDEGALADAERVLALEPGRVGAHLARGELLVARGRWEEAGRERLFVRQASPYTRQDPIWGSRVVLHLAQLGWGAHLAGRRADAVRILTLARALSPGDPDLEARLRSASKVRGPAVAVGAEGRRVPSRDPVEVPGRLVDEEGRPVADARVFALRADTPQDILATYAPEGAAGTRTDSNGGFVVRVAPGPALVVAIAEGTLRRACALALDAEGARAEPVTMAFAGTGSIVGTVIARGGRPVAGLQVRALADGAPRASEAFPIAFTDTDGRFVIAGVGPGSHRLHARGAGMWTEGAPAGTASAVVTVSPIALLRGRVLQALPDGPPVPLRRFTVHDAEGIELSVDSADGTFEVPVRKHWAGMTVVIHGFGLAPLTRVVDVLPAARVDLGDLVLSRGRPVVGRVVDATGAPVAGAWVTAGGVSHLWRPITAATDAEGRFTLEWLSGETGAVYVARAGYQGEQVAVTPGGAPVEVRLRSGLSVTFRVEDVDGRTLSGVKLLARGKKGATCISNEEGLCTLSGLDQAEYGLSASRLPDGSVRPRPRPLRFTATADAGTLVYRYPRSRSVLRVRTIDTAGGVERTSLLIAPGAYSRASWIDAHGAIPEPHYVAGFKEQQEIDDLPDGHYTLMARTTRRCGFQEVDLVEGAVRAIDIRLEAGDCPSPP